MLSKYVSKIYLKKDVYAVFNNFIMQVLFLNKEKVNHLFNNEMDYFNNEEMKLLIDSGIIIKNKEIDEKIIKLIKDTHKNRIENRISLMYIIPTNTCNLSCKYCFIGKLNNKILNMSFETAKKAVDLFASHISTIDMPGTILFYGGEPLINFDLIKKIVVYVKKNKYNISFSMVSNGLLINDEIAKFIKENNIALGISIDGPKEITNENRVYKDNKSGIYEDLIKKIKLLQSYNVDFGLSITIAPIFLNNKKSFIKWLEELNVKSISYNLMHFTYKTDEWKKYYKDAVDFIYYSNNKLFNKGFDEDRINRKYKSFYEKEFKYSDCGAVGANQITICPDGSIEICHGYWNNDSHDLGNINDLNTLEDLFNNNYYNEWKSYISINKEKCLRCPAVYICGGGCAMQSKDLFGNPNKIDKAFCIYSKKMLKNILKEVYIDTMK